MAERSSSTGVRTAVSIVATPWVGVPPKGMGSLSKITHEMTRRLADRYEFSIFAGPSGRDPGVEHPDIEYVSINRRVDARYIDRLVGMTDRIRGIKRHKLDRFWYHPLWATRVARRLAERRPHVVIVHQCPQWLRPIRRALPETTVLFWANAVNMVEGNPRLLSDLELADGVLACSNYVAATFVRRLPGLRDRIHVVYNGLDTDLFSPAESPNGDATRIVFAGRITPEKGPHLLVDAFARLSEEYPDLELTLAGPVWKGGRFSTDASSEHIAEIESMPADYLAELRKRAGPAVDRLRTPGPIFGNDLVNLYRRAAVFAHVPLWAEPFGMPVIEAQAAGTPVVVSRSGGIPELVHEGRTGLIVERGDIDALTRALGALLDDRELRESMGRAAARHARSRFGWMESAQALSKAIDSFR